MPTNDEKEVKDGAGAAQERRRQLEEYLRKKEEKKKNLGKAVRPNENKIPNLKSDQVEAIKLEAADMTDASATYTIPVKVDQGNTVPQTPATPATMQLDDYSTVSSKMSETGLSFKTPKPIEDPFCSKTPSVLRPNSASMLCQYELIVPNKQVETSRGNIILCSCYPLVQRFE